LKKSDALGYKWGKVESLIAIGHNYQHLHQYTEAVKYLSNALHIASGIRALDQAEDICKLLHACYFQLGKYEIAYNYQGLYNQYIDSLNKEEQIRKLAHIESSYEIDRKETENKLLLQENFVKNLQIKRQNTIFLSALVMVALLVGFVYALYRGNVRRKYVNRQLTQKNQEINLHKEEIMAQSEQILQQNRELAKANEVLAELNQEKDNLIGVVAHDLRSPLNKVKGFTELIPLSGPVNEEQDFYLKMIDEVVDSGNRLIAELLEVSHLDSFNTQFHIAPLELYSFTEELIHNYELPAQKKKIHISLMHNIEEMVIHTDRDALRRILENLLSNALKFSSKNNQVQVKLHYHEKVTQISIKDEGPGIYENDRKKLFKKFQKLSAKPTGGESSTGLGLYIVKVLTERMGGTVSVISEPGHGAEFIVKLPTCRNETVSV
jgi:signal transduction histidine kinase